MTFGTEGSPETGRFAYGTEHTTETVVNPLYGLRRTGDREYALNELVDWSVPPIRYGPWLKTKSLQIDSTTVTAEDLLNMMVNREGAHSELNELGRMNAGGPLDIKSGDAKDEKYRKANVINFSGISYIQIFTFLVGHYLARMMKNTLRHIPEDLTKGNTAPDVWQTIMETPTELASMRLSLERPYAMGAVYRANGDAENPLELIGDYTKPSETLVQIPGWV